MVSNIFISCCEATLASDITYFIVRYSFFIYFFLNIFPKLCVSRIPLLEVFVFQVMELNINFLIMSILHIIQAFQQRKLQLIITDQQKKVTTNFNFIRSTAFKIFLEIEAIIAWQ